MQLSSKDLRFHTKSALDAVKRGEQVYITFHGKIVAIMVAPETIETIDPEIKTEDLAAFGMWADREEITDAAAYVQKLRQPRYKL